MVRPLDKQLDPSFFALFNRVQNIALDDTLNEKSGLSYDWDRNYILAVDDGRIVRRISPDGSAVIGTDVTLSTHFNDPEAIIYLGNTWKNGSEGNVAILDEGTAVLDVKIDIVTIDENTTTLAVGDATTYTLASIPFAPAEGGFSGMGAEHFGYDPDTGLWYVGNQYWGAGHGLWECDLTVTPTPKQTLLYDWQTVLYGPGYIAGQNVHSGSEYNPYLLGGRFKNSYFVLCRNFADTENTIFQLDLKTGKVIAYISHGIGGQLEGVCFLAGPNGAGPQWLIYAGEQANPNFWRHDYLTKEILPPNGHFSRSNTAAAAACIVKTPYPNNGERLEITGIDASYSNGTSIGLLSVSYDTDDLTDIYHEYVHGSLSRRFPQPIAVPVGENIHVDLASSAVTGKVTVYGRLV